MLINEDLIVLNLASQNPKAEAIQMLAEKDRCSWAGG